MQLEVEHRREFHSEMATWYWGGGTPSVLPTEVLSTLVHHFERYVPLKKGGEFTLEANPEDLSMTQIEAWRKLGINRLSVGIQSFVDSRLQWMNRSHSREDALAGIARAQDAGIENISVDLIYGLPGTSLGEWQDNVGMAMELGVPHLSTYALTVEDRTALHASIKKGKSPGVNEDRANEDFLWLRGHLRSNGWDPYELSNACLAGWRAEHNSGYWSGEAYLGIGPGAHSFDGKRLRSWNKSNNGIYLQVWQKKHGLNDFDITACQEFETLNERDRINEQILTNLRRSEGLDREDMGEHAVYLDTVWENYEKRGWVVKSSTHWKLSDAGLLWLNRIASEGFMATSDVN